MSDIDVENLHNHVQTIYEAVEYGKKLCQEDKAEEVQELLEDLNVLVDMVQAMLAQDRGHLLPLAIVCCKNIRYSIEQFDNDIQNRYRILNMEIMNMAWNLKNIVHKQYDILNNKDNTRRNQSEILERAIKMHDMVKKNKNKQFKYKVSIIVTAYNKLEYTKAAIESIYKYTDFSKGDVELITKNNGSTDGTQEYFESLPNKKKINYRYNAIGTSDSPDIFDGKYIVGFSNDVVATPNWLENLLTCIESDDNIICAVPTCQDYAISCSQGIHVDYDNTFEALPQMEDFAQSYNKSNSRLWEERPFVMPFVSVMRRELFEVDIHDPSYIQAQFIDDDVSTVYRRSGWKQILAKDTFMHHFGSVTLGDINDTMNTNGFINMRKVFYSKWGVDAWQSRGIISCSNVVFDCCDIQDDDKILWIDPLFGYNFLDFRNRYIRDNKSLGNANAIVTNAKYQKDAEAYFSNVVVNKDVIAALSKDDSQYNIIAMSRHINEIISNNLWDTVIMLYEHLAPNGYLMIPIKNFSSAKEIYEFLSIGSNNKPFFDIESYNHVDIERFIDMLEKNILGIKYKIFRVVNDNGIVERVNNAMINMGISVDDNTYNTLKMEMAWFLIKR